MAKAKTGSTKIFMSYDIELIDPITKKCLELDESHHIKGGSYCVELYIIWNYCKYFVRVFPKRNSEQGIRSLYGLTGAESIAVLKNAIVQLGDDVSDNYWDATEGNAKRSLLQLLALAEMRPDGVWDGD